MRFFCLALCVSCGGAGVDVCSVMPGDVVITELGVRGESYVELFAVRDVELSQLVVAIAGTGRARDTSLDGTLQAGDYASIPVDAIADDGGTVVLRCSSSSDVVDRVVYERTSATVLALDGGDDPPDAAANDDVRAWCPQVASAGEPNARCPLADCPDSGARLVVAGDLLITEANGNPKGADAGNEWVEINVAAAEDITLAGLALVHAREDGTSRRWALGCDVVPAGSYVVLRPDELALYNTSGTTLSVIASDDTPIDSVALPSLSSDGQVAMRDGDAFCLVAEVDATPGRAGACAP